jgi:hypothetical protein
MQRLISATITGNPGERKPITHLWIDGTWILIEHVHEPPYRLRVVQLIRHEHFWLALVESLDDSQSS